MVWQLGPAGHRRGPGNLVFTQPLSWLHFHIVSPIAIPLNLFAAFRRTWQRLLCGFFALITDLVGLPWLPDLFGGLARCRSMRLDLLVRAAELGPAGVRLSAGSADLGRRCCSMECGRPAAWYGSIPLRHLIAASCLWLAVMMGLTLNLFGGDGHPASPRLTFISVGHGLSTLIELPQGQTILYDSGRLGQPEPVAQWHLERLSWLAEKRGSMRS